MKYITKTLAVVLFLNILSKASSAFSKEWRLQKSGPFAYDKQLTKNIKTFAYVQCEANYKILDCDFALKNLIDPLNDLLCPVKLVATENNLIRRNIKIERLGPKSILYIWSQDSADNSKRVTTYNVLNMSTCNIVYTKQITQNLDNPSTPGKALPFVTYDNAFDIIDYEGGSCDSSNICRINYDNDKGLVTHLPLPGNLSALTLIPVNSQSAIDGFFALDGQVNSDMAVNYVAPTGIISPLIILPTNISSYWIATNVRGKFTICVQLKGPKGYDIHKIECFQYNKKGRLLISKKIDLEEDTKVSGIHNLKDGGFLILTAKCFDVYSLFTTVSCSQPRAMRIDEDGEVRESFEVPTPIVRCKRQLAQDSMRILEKESEYCFYFTSVCIDNIEKKEITTIKFERKCI